MVDLLIEKGVKGAKVFMLPNWVDTDTVRPLDRESRYRQLLGIPPNAIVALYSGNMGLKQGLELLADVAKEVSTEQLVHFVFGGEGPAVGILQQKCRGLSNVHFLPLQDERDLNEWLGLADIHLLPQTARVADLVMPSKLTGMLASGRPILATATVGTELERQLVRCGIVTPPGDVQAFSQALLTLARDQSLRSSLGSMGRVKAEDQLSREKVLASFEDAILRSDTP